MADFHNPRMSPADQTAADMEAAWEAYRLAADECAEAENEYLGVFAKALLLSDAPVSIRQKLAEAEAVEERKVWNIKKAAQKSALLKFEEVKSRNMTALSNQRMVRDQT